MPPTSALSRNIPAVVMAGEGGCRGIIGPASTPLSWARINPPMALLQQNKQTKGDDGKILMNASGKSGGMIQPGAAVRFCYLFHAITFLAEGLFIKVVGQVITFNGCLIDHCVKPFAPPRKHRYDVGDHWFYLIAPLASRRIALRRCGVIGHMPTVMLCSRSNVVNGEIERLKSHTDANHFTILPQHVDGLLSAQCWHRSIRSPDRGCLCRKSPGSVRDDIFREPLTNAIAPSSLATGNGQEHPHPCQPPRYFRPIMRAIWTENRPNGPVPMTTTCPAA